MQGVTSGSRSVLSYMGDVLFPCSADIQDTVSTHVETVVLMSRSGKSDAKGDKR